jgi:anhydro-N-acetylmuramic acid kinase
MAVKATMKVLGFMTGTSLDAVDMAVIDTDGERLIALGPAGERKLEPGARAVVEAAIAAAQAWPLGAPEPPAFAVAAKVVAEQHLLAARGFLADLGIAPGEIDLVGVHGQTVRHEPRTPSRPNGRTAQLIDAGMVADGLGLPVVCDFRSADVAAGGQGAPLAPVYHAALARWSGLEAPIAVLNLGGVGNITLINAAGDLEAHDTGPANGMIDLLVQARTGARRDQDGALARAGRVDPVVLSAYLADPYFTTRGPKSLDRLDFSLEPVAGLSLEDAAATLTAFAAEAAAIGLRSLSATPSRVVVCGGGRLNPALMDALGARLPVPVVAAEAVGWRGDSIEAEAFAYLAARSARGLPIAFPSTTGAPVAITGGRLVRPRARRLEPPES